MSNNTPLLYLLNNVTITKYANTGRKESKLLSSFLKCECANIYVLIIMKISKATNRFNKRNCFNDPAWESSGWNGWCGVGDIPNTYIQLAGGGSMFM